MDSSYDTADLKCPFCLNPIADSKKTAPPQVNDIQISRRVICPDAISIGISNRNPNRTDGFRSPSMWVERLF